MNLKEANRFMKRTVSRTRYEAKSRRNLDFDIDVDYIMFILTRQDGKCALTGWDLEFTRGGSWGGRNPRGATIDRINNSLGYIPGNIQVVCGLPNILRGTMPLENFKNLCRDIADHTK
jgi:hypothetical protein